MKRSKRYSSLSKLIEPKEYSLDEAVDLLKRTAQAKFDESVEIAIRLGVDPRRSEQAIRGLSQEVLDLIALAGLDLLPGSTSQSLPGPFESEPQLTVGLISHDFNAALI